MNNQSDVRSIGEIIDEAIEAKAFWQDPVVYEGFTAMYTDNGNYLLWGDLKLLYWTDDLKTIIKYYGEHNEIW